MNRESLNNIAPAVSRVTIAITPRYAESDQMGFIHHSTHIIWFEAARMALFEANGVNLTALEREGILFPVTHVEAKYISPAFYADKISVTAHFYKKTNVRICIRYDISYENGKTLCSGYTEHAFIKKSSYKPIRIPAWIENIIETES